MQRSSMSRDCSGSYFDKSMLERIAREARTAGEDILRVVRVVRRSKEERGRLYIYEVEVHLIKSPVWCHISAKY